MFKPVESSVSLPQLEEKDHPVLEDAADLRKIAGCPRRWPRPSSSMKARPTANGLPHPGHCLTRAIKDLFPRYKTMRGFRCDRKAGWDTHGLPVEVEVCKELGIHAKEEIEAYGVEPFVHKCVESVFRYTRQWEHLTERLGFWIHLGRGLRHLPPELRGERLVGAEEPLRPRPALPGPQDRLVVGPRAARP